MTTDFNGEFMLYQLKKFSVLGDSISTFFGYSQPPEAVFYSSINRYETGVCSVSDTWWSKVIDALGGQLLVNDSFSGSTVTFDPRYEIASYGCSDERTSSLDANGKTPDVILVFMGINDRGSGVLLRPTREEEKKDPRIFSEAYSEMLRKLQTNYPKAELWCLSLPLGSLDGYAPSAAARQKNEEYSKVVAECAAHKNCRLIDICKMKPYESIDGLHPNADGMNRIAEAVLAALNNNS